MAFKPVKLPSGRWRVRWRDHEGKRQSATYETEAGAESALRRVQVHVEDITTGRAPAPAPPAPTFKTFVDERWWPTYPKAARNQPLTVREKRGHLDLYLLPELANVRLDLVRGEVVDRLLARLAPDPECDDDDAEDTSLGLSAKTVKNVLATLRRILQSAKDWGVIADVPALRKVKVSEAETDFLTPAEAPLLLAAARDDEERAMLMCAIQTGARAGEQRAIEWGDIDFVNGRVFIRRSMSGRSRKAKPPKSGKGRDVPLTPDLARALKAIRHLKGPLVFCNLDGRPYTPDLMRAWLWSALARAGLRRMRWHDLRHTYASHLVMANVPLVKVQKLMGHATITMTMRYAHLAPGNDNDVVGALGGASSVGHTEATTGQVSGL